MRKIVSYLLGFLYLSGGIGEILSFLGAVGFFTPDPFAAFAFVTIGAMLITKAEDDSYFLVSLLLGVVIMIIYVLSFAATWLDSIIVGEDFNPTVEEFNLYAIILGITSLLALWYYKPWEERKDKK